MWNYIFGLSNDASSFDASVTETLGGLRSEFEYFYNKGIDLRVSGYDLVKNHLTMSLYTM